MKYVKMVSFGKYIRELREKQELPLRKVAAELDIDTSILSKIERGERNATKEMLPILAKVLKENEKEIQIKFIVYMLNKNFGELQFLKEGLKEAIKEI